RIVELQRLEQEKFRNTLNVAARIGDTLINKLNIAGDSFFAKMVDTLHTVEEIVILIESIKTAFSIFSFFGFGGSPGGGAGMARASGGPVLSNKPYVVGEKGMEIF